MSLLRWVLDLLYPPLCPFCQRLLDRHAGEEFLCERCRGELPWLRGVRVSRVLEDGTACLSVLRYEGDAAQSIRRYKFSGRRMYAPCYGELLSRIAPAGELVSWMPLGPKRRRERGYNQAELMARELARRIVVPAVPLLDKPRDTQAQSGLDAQEARQANVSGAYRPLEGADCRGKRVLLVDDVVTTGSTLQEGCQVLREMGAEEVVCLTLARARES